MTLPDAKAGDNTLAILVKASPRSKGPSYGLIGRRNARGIWGGISYDKASTPLPVTWKKGENVATDADPDDLAKPDYNDSAWSSVDASSIAGEIQLPHGNSWYRGTFNLTPDQADSILEAPGFSSTKRDARHNLPPPAKTICYINGHLLDERVQDSAKILVAGKNTILLEMQSRLGDDRGNLSIALWRNSPLTKATWYFRGGLDDLDETAIIGRVTDWSDFLSHRPWEKGEPTTVAQPTFWKCNFNYHQPAGLRQTIGLITDGLKAGHVWLNGHNLGECPQTVLMYMPECWLKEGKNDLVIFDLYGAKPEKIQLARYEAFSIADPR